MFFGNSKELEKKIAKLEEEIHSLKEKNKSLLQENESTKNDKESAYQTIEHLKTTNDELISQMKQLQVAEDQSPKVTCNDGNLQLLFKMQNSNLKTGLLDIQANLADSTELSRKSLSNVDEIDKIFETSNGDFNTIIRDINELNKDADDVNTSVIQLDQNAQNITKSIDLINNIVLQINILSLNASVEAATAGEAGKGFAVVASEVKTLANKTAEAAKNIEEVVKAIKESIANTNQKFELINKHIDKITTATQSYNTDIQRAFSTSKESFNGIGNITDRVFMSLAKLDHIIWKVNTYLSIANKEPAFAFVDHKNCRLGKWYNEGMGKQYFSNTPSYPLLDKPHSIVHNGTHHVFDSISEDKTIDFEKAISAFEEMESASHQVFKLLDAILVEKH